MNKPANQQIEVQIMGQSYLLACPEGGEASLLDAVERVDTAMCRIRDAGKVKARDRIAVLASLNLAFELCQKERLAPSMPGDTPSEVATTASKPSETAPGVDAGAQNRATDLLRRLDNALGQDGQLL
ncbi:MAG: cell division protein ZapA [Hydrogenophaga sp.]